MFIYDRISELPARDPVPSGTLVHLKRVVDDVTIMTASTDANGFVSFQANGSPGPTYMEVEVGTETRVRYGTVQSQVGPWFTGELGSFLQATGSGVNRFDTDAMAVVAGSGLTTKVSPGSCIADGILAKWYTQETVSHAANSSGLTRYDAVCIAIWIEGSEAGKSMIQVVQGGSTTVSTAQLEANRDPNTHLIVLAYVRVQSGASLIQATDIEDRRVYASAVGDNMIQTSHLQDGSVTNAKVATGAITADKIADDAVIGSKIAHDAIGSGNLKDGAVTGPKLVAESITGDKIAADTIMPGNMDTTWRPRVVKNDSDTDANYSGSATLIAADHTLEAGSYTWMAWGWIRATDTSSSVSPRGWLKIIREGIEEAAEYFYLPGNYSGDGGSVQVMSSGTFTAAGSRVEDFDLSIAMDQGIATVNSRQLMVWVQRIA